MTARTEMTKVYTKIQYHEMSIDLSIAEGKNKLFSKHQRPFFIITSKKKKKIGFSACSLI